MASNPEWLDVHVVAGTQETGVARHRGEREAIFLAQVLKADLLILDELRPRQIARDLGISVVSTLGILIRGAAQGSVELIEVVDQLRRLDFRASDRIPAEVLKSRIV